MIGRIDRGEGKTGQPIDTLAHLVGGPLVPLRLESPVKQGFNQHGIDIVERDQGGTVRHQRAPLRRQGSAVYASIYFFVRCSSRPSLPSSST